MQQFLAATASVVACQLKCAGLYVAVSAQQVMRNASCRLISHTSIDSGHLSRVCSAVMSVCVCPMSWFVVRTLALGWQIAGAVYVDNSGCDAQTYRGILCTSACTAVLRIWQSGIAFVHLASVGILHDLSCDFSKFMADLYQPQQPFCHPSQPKISIPGVGDLRNLNVDLSDVPDGRYREVEVRVWSTTAHTAQQ